MKTDLDRLHAVAQLRRWPPPPRRCGQTMFDCHCVAGALGVGERMVVVLAPRMQYLNHVQPMLASVLEELGFSFKARKSTLWQVDGPEGNASVWFLSSASNSLRGLDREIALVDFDDDSKYRVDESDTSEATRAALGRYTFGKE